ncbi:MAG: hypothetical protein HDS51_05055 [Barnesiella sp.]|nr:hypothetical protein [Barnesiella sp.]
MDKNTFPLHRLACFGECTGISFVDSTCIPVIHNKRQFNMKVFKGIAEKGKSYISQSLFGRLWDAGVHIVKYEEMPDASL